MAEIEGRQRKLYEQVASTLDLNDIVLDNVYFINSPHASIFITNDKGTIFDYSASYYVTASTRRVLFEKTKYKYTVSNFQNVSNMPNEATKNVTNMYVMANTYSVKPLIDNESVYYSLKRFIEAHGRTHIVFLYVFDDMLKNLESSRLIRMALLDIGKIKV